MKKIKKFFAVLLAALLVAGILPTMSITALADPAVSAEGDWGSLHWTLDSEGLLTITGTGEMDTFIDLASAWRVYKDEIKSISIGDSVTSICDGAFENCNSLTSVSIGDSVVNIGYWAFYGCSSLESITIPDSVANIGYCAFENCSSLETITVSSGNTVYDSRNNCNAIIETATDTLICGCNTTVIPDNVESIGDRAFSGCSGLVSINIPDSVTSIGNQVFMGCSSLETITVSVENTVYDSRNDCNAIVETATDTLVSGCKATVIPDSVTSIGEWAFSGCSSLESINIPDSVTSIGNDAFSGCSSLVSINISDSVTSIGVYAFDGCSSLENIIIPNSVTSIGTSAFEECSSLESINIPNGVTSIGERTFYGCSSLANVSIGSGVTSIGWGVFLDCSSLESINIPDSVTSIGESAFFGCSNLASISIPDSVTSIGDSAFCMCNLRDVYYGGTEEQAKAISVGINNEPLQNATWHYTLKPSTVTLKSKSAAYTGKAISIGTATKTGSTGKITYTYYTDSACKTKTSKTNSGASSTGGAPVKIGTYYVKAVLAADTNYNSATSKAVKLTIVKGTSTVTLKAKTATYTGKAISIGTATKTGSTGKITYTYYTDSACKTKTSKTNSGASSTGGAPVKIGTYYVKAVLAADTNYNSATSKAVKLTIVKGTSTVTLKAKTAAYTGKAISIGTAKTTGSKGKVTYTYYTNSKCTTKTSKTNSGASLTGGAPVYAGTYYVKAVLAKDANYNSAVSKAVKLTIAKKAPTIKVKTSSKTYTKATVKKKAQSFSIGASVSGKGKLSYAKSSGSKYLSVSKTSGKVTVKKGTPKGTYSIKVKVSAKASANYKAASKTFTVKVKVK